MRYLILFISLIIAYSAEAKQESWLKKQDIVPPIKTEEGQQQIRPTADRLQAEPLSPSDKTKKVGSQPKQEHHHRHNIVNDDNVATQPHKSDKEKIHSDRKDIEKSDRHHHKEAYHAEKPKKNGVYLNVNIGSNVSAPRRVIDNPPITVIRPIVYENNIYTNNAYSCRAIKEVKYCTDYQGRALNGRIVQNYGDNVAYEYYKNGYQNGETSVFDEDGTLLRKTEYKKGKKHGKEVVYYANGKIEYKAEYKKGALDGSVLQYDVNGKQIGRMTYRNGRWQFRSCKYKTEDPELLLQIKQKNYNELILCNTIY